MYKINNKKIEKYSLLNFLYWKKNDTSFQNNYHFIQVGASKKIPFLKSILGAVTHEVQAMSKFENI